jgi:hypothetical protein
LPANGAFLRSHQIMGAPLAILRSTPPRGAGCPSVCPPRPINPIRHCGSYCGGVLAHGYVPPSCFGHQPTRIVAAADGVLLAEYIALDAVCAKRGATLRRVAADWSTGRGPRRGRPSGRRDGQGCEACRERPAPWLRFRRAVGQHDVQPHPRPVNGWPIGWSRGSSSPVTPSTRPVTG